MILDKFHGRGTRVLSEAWAQTTNPGIIERGPLLRPGRL